MNCKICLKEIDEPVHCEICGDDGFCDDCAADCSNLDEEVGFEDITID